MIFGTPGDAFWTALNGSILTQYAGLDASPLEALVMRQPTNKKDVTDRAFGDLGMPEEWVDELHLQGFGQYQVTIPIKEYGTIIGIDDFDLQANDLAPYLPKAGELAMTCRWYWVNRLRALLNDGATTTHGTWYDGKAFFAADHEIGASGAFSNIIEGTGVTADKLNADLGTARARMAGFKNDKGDPQIIPYEPDTVLYDAADEDLQAAMDILYLGAVIHGQPNWRGRVKQVIADPGLTGTGMWYAVCTTRPQKPFRVLPGSRGVQAGEMESGGGDGWIEVDYRKTTKPEWLYIWKCRSGFYYGDPRLICRVDNS